MVLLDEPDVVLEDLGFEENQQILVESKSCMFVECFALVLLSLPIAYSTE